VAAVSLGARAWQVLRRITLPNVKWGLLYGIILCNARAMGEFGAVTSSPATSPARPTPCPCGSKSCSRSTNNPGAFALASLLSFARAGHLAV